ncbi:uncharacterized protein VTP21DRAFT_4756 [Calcarisporiella thermophila]|uniref:uncharacterized protein n=1 Tax=Calcarisporiella thermophila TaxID=911321 RepID=UPI0037422313
MPQAACRLGRRGGEEEEGPVSHSPSYDFLLCGGPPQLPAGPFSCFRSKGQGHAPEHIELSSAYANAGPSYSVSALWAVLVGRLQEQTLDLSCLDPMQVECTRFISPINLFPAQLEREKG